MNLLEAIYNALRLPELRNKLLFTAFLLIAFRFFANITIPNANQQALSQLFNSQALLGLLDLFSGGGLSTFSVVAMGVNPYINASIIMQLMTVISERVKEISKEGEQGRRRITRWTRYLTVVLALGPIAFVIEVQQAVRKIPIQSAQRLTGGRTVQGRQSFLPLRVNQAGVIPIIFALSIMTFPGIVAGYLQATPTGTPWHDA